MNVKIFLVVVDDQDELFEQHYRRFLLLGNFESVIKLLLNKAFKVFFSGWKKILLVVEDDKDALTDQHYHRFLLLEKLSKILHGRCAKLSKFSHLGNQ